MSTPAIQPTPIRGQATTSRHREHVSARTRAHDVFDPQDRSNPARRAEEMSRISGRHVEPAFAAEADWDLQDENLRIPVRQIRWDSPVINSTLTATNVSTDPRSILIEPTVAHNTVRSNALGTGYPPQIGNTTNVHPLFGESRNLIPTVEPVVEPPQPINVSRCGYVSTMGR